MHSSIDVIAAARGLPHAWTPRVLALAAVAAACGAMASPALASSDKMLPGSSCVRWAGPLPAYSWGEIINPSSTEVMNVDCPFDKEEVGRGFSDGYVAVVDRDPRRIPQGDVRCFPVRVQLTHLGAFVPHMGIEKRSIVGSAPTVSQFLRFGSIPWSVGGGHHWFFSCDIPPLSGIQGYFVNELP